MHQTFCGEPISRLVVVRLSDGTLTFHRPKPCFCSKPSNLREDQTCDTGNV